MTKGTLSLAEKKDIVVTFLKQCNEYSESILNKYQKQLSDEELSRSAAQKIQDWKTYKDFNEYAIKELKGDELDEWFK